MSIQIVRSQIRFALEQLKPQNKYHEFEDIAREFTRQRICKNLLPATGPVGAGGDQGRDFETFHTYLDDSLSIDDTYLFEGVSKTGNIFFACSLQEEIAPKIKSDIRSIFSYTSEKRPISYFCVEDVPVGHRNKLIQWCQDENDVALQIFDGQALAENLSDPDIFWIAVEFLNIPADIYPKPTNDDELYNEYREIWIEKDTQPINVSDYCQIKYGLRIATFNTKLNPDLPAWIEAIKKLLGDGNSSQNRKVQYEICVAALRGQNNLTAYKDTVIEYFEDFEKISDPSELTDVSVLLSYCSTAQTVGQFEIETAYLHETSKRFVAHVDNFLNEVEFANTKCLLLDIKARSCFFPFLESETASVDIDGAFEYWDELIKTVGNAPLFPLEQLSDVLGILIPFIGTDKRYLELTNELDELLAKRAGDFKAADKCKDRAIAFYKNGHILQAIDHLHRAKIKWFSAETLRGTILSSRFIAHCYDELGLLYAAKYYLFSSFYLAFRSDDESLHDLISISIFESAEICYRSGEWINFFCIINLALMIHHKFDRDRLDINKHENLARIFLYSVIVRNLTLRFWEPLNGIIETKYSEWLIDDELRVELTKLIEEQPKDSYWLSASLEEIWKQLEDELAGRPFSDVGKNREIIWKANGIQWKVHFTNDYETTRISEEFVAVLQVLLVDLSQDDYQILPVRVTLNISLSDDNKFHVIEEFSNERLEWNIKIPKFEGGVTHDEDHTSHIFAYAVSVLGFCTTLEYNEFHDKIERAMKKGLSSKTFFARPYPEIYGEIIPPEMFNQDERRKIEPVEQDRPYDFPQHENLSWRNMPGLHYSEEEAHGHINNRYEAMKGMMKIIWPKILLDRQHNEYFKNLHESGYLDWHIGLIACNTIANYVANKKTWRGIANDEYKIEMGNIVQSIFNGKMDEQIQQLDISEIDIEHIDGQEKMSLVIIMKRWGLSIHTPTPDFTAIKHFLGERYKIFEIDSPHDPLF